MSQMSRNRPTVKIRINAVGRGSVTIDDGPELPVRRLSLEAGVNASTIVRFELVAPNIDAELPVDEVITMPHWRDDADDQCRHPSSVSDAYCDLPMGHPQWKPDRFHRFVPPGGLAGMAEQEPNEK